MLSAAELIARTVGLRTRAGPTNRIPARPRPRQPASPHRCATRQRTEQEVLCLLAQGRSNRAIARQLGLSEATVKGHVSRLLDKLNAPSRLEAVVRATDTGLV